MNAWEKHRRVFDNIDRDRDGRISAAELKECVEAIGAASLTLTEAEAAVEAVDSDGDGLLGIEDFVRLMEEIEEEEKDGCLREAFRMYENEEGCGSITPRSLKRMLGKMGEFRSVQECKVMIASFDLDGDGVLSFDEFRTMME